MSGTVTLSLKFAGGNRPVERVSIEPGTTVADVLRSIELDPTGFHITDPNNPDAVFNLSDNLYARPEVEDGKLLVVTAAVDAGSRNDAQRDLMKYCQFLVELKCLATHALIKAETFAAHDLLCEAGKADWHHTTTALANEIETAIRALPFLVPEPEIGGSRTDTEELPV